ncbi:hypothetical protein PQZ40_01995 [Alphaproteobacteria bacterium]|nr:hypothetical protein [Alphaproteobacteria bacterium]
MKVLKSDLRLLVHSAIVSPCSYKDKRLLRMSVPLRGLKAAAVLISIFLSLTVAPANADMAYFSLDREYHASDDKNDAKECMGALMDGNLLHLSGDDWDKEGNIKFLSFYQGKVFVFYGFAYDLICNRDDNGAGKLRTKGLMDKEWNSK